MSTFHPIPFEILVKRVFYEYKFYGKILGMSKEKFFTGLPGGNPGVHYLGKPVSTPLGPAAGPHTQLAQNILLAWLSGCRCIELKTIQLLDTLELPRPCIDTETIGFNVEWSQELPLEASLREYVKAWMLIEMIKQSNLLGDDFGVEYGDTIFDVSIGYDYKGIKSGKITRYIRELMNAHTHINALRQEIPPEFSSCKDFEYPPHIIESITLSTFHGCPVEELDLIISHLLTEHHVNVIVKLNPTLLGKAEVTHLLSDVLGYADLTVPADVFERDLTFDRALELLEHLTQTATSCGKTLGLKLSNTLVVNNQKGYLPGDLMYLSGAPLHVLALQLLKRLRIGLGELYHHIPISFSAGIDEKNFANVVSLKIAPVTVCTDLLKPPGYEKCTSYLARLGQQMDAADAINVSDYIMKRFGHEVSAVNKVFDYLQHEVECLAPQLPEQSREATIQEQLEIFDTLQERVLAALKDNSDSLELLTTGALIITETLKTYNQKFGSNFLFPHTFRELYERILSAAAEQNLETLFDETIQNPRYTYAENRLSPKKLSSELQRYDCINCLHCVRVCPNTANFTYQVSPVTLPYVNYQLTREGFTTVSGGTFAIKKATQIANFADCCNECSVCAIHCGEQGKPYLAKPTYFGSREQWAARQNREGFFVEKSGAVESIDGRINGAEYQLQFDRDLKTITFSDGVLEGIFEYPAHTLVKTTILHTGKFGHIFEMNFYFILLTQLQGILNEETCNYVNVRYL